MDGRVGWGRWGPDTPRQPLCGLPQCIGHHNCSYKVKTKLPGAKKTTNFCRNEHNVTGQCNRSSCPLANSRYATVVEKEGRCYLMVKTIERAHMPKKLWQKIRLSKQYDKALEQIDAHLEHWPQYLVHKNKQRLTKITQMLIRMRKLALKAKTKLVPISARTEKRNLRREKKALTAANVERSIEKELLKRLQAGEYGDIYNYPLKQYNKVLDENEEEAEEELEEEEELEGLEAVDAAVAGAESEEEEEEAQFVEDFSESEEEESDLEDLDMGLGPTAEAGRGAWKGKGKKGKRKPTIELEYEEEPAPQRRQQAAW